MPLKIYFEDNPRTINENDGLLKKYQLIKAAGGLVINDHGEILMIFRRGKWDLPKGKFEDNETPEECAEREVKEETGLKELRLKKWLLNSHHTYMDKFTHYLKETHWFLFDAPGEQVVQPQTEEDISRIEWVKPGNLPEYTNNTFGLIKDVLKEGGF